MKNWKTNRLGYVLIAVVFINIAWYIFNIPHGDIAFRASFLIGLALAAWGFFLSKDHDADKKEDVSVASGDDEDKNPPGTGGGIG